MHNCILFALIALDSGYNMCDKYQFAGEVGECQKTKPVLTLIHLIKIN